MRGAVTIFILLCLSFLSFSFFLYLTPESPSGNITETRLASRGKLVWQKHNCQVCHQLYGLGGYLGPDLTNLCRDTVTGFAKIEIMTGSGSIQMPRFNLSQDELRQLQSFLYSISQTGNGDPRSFETHFTGMISEK